MLKVNEVKCVKANKMKKSVDQNTKKDFFRVKIGELSLRLKSSYDEETVKKIVSSVNKKLTKSRSRLKSGSFQMATILTALNIAEENWLLKQRILSGLDEVEEKAQKILKELESPQKKTPSSQKMSYFKGM